MKRCVTMEDMKGLSSELFYNIKFDKKLFISSRDVERGGFFFIRKQKKTAWEKKKPMHVTRKKKKNRA